MLSEKATGAYQYICFIVYRMLRQLYRGFEYRGHTAYTCDDPILRSDIMIISFVCIYTFHTRNATQTKM